MIYGIDDSYNNLLLRSSCVSIHQKHVRFLVTEIFKSISQINPEFMWSFFKQKKLPENLTQSTYYGTNAVHFRGSFLWSNLSTKVKSSNSAFEFITKIKNLGSIEVETGFTGKLVLRQYDFYC